MRTNAFILTLALATLTAACGRTATVAHDRDLRTVASTPAPAPAAGPSKSELDELRKQFEELRQENENLKQRIGDDARMNAAQGAPQGATGGAADQAFLNPQKKVVRLWVGPPPGCPGVRTVKLPNESSYYATFSLYGLPTLIQAPGGGVWPKLPPGVERWFCMPSFAPITISVRYESMGTNEDTGLTEFVPVADFRRTIAIPTKVDATGRHEIWVDNNSMDLGPHFRR